MSTVGLSPQEWTVTQSLLCPLVTAHPLFPHHQLLEQTTPHPHPGEGTLRCDCRDHGARGGTLRQAQHWEASRSPRWRLPPPATICCLAPGLGEHVGRQGKPVPSRHSLPQRGRGVCDPKDITPQARVTQVLWGRLKGVPAGALGPEKPSDSALAVASGTATLASHQPLRSRARGCRGPILSTKAFRLQPAGRGWGRCPLSTDRSKRC